MFDKLIFKTFGGVKLEQKLIRCQSYTVNNIYKWKQQTNLTWKETFKFLKNIHVFDAAKIRSILEDIVENNPDICHQENLYITSFGSEGKSGGKISYELRHTNLFNSNKFIESWRLQELPEGSTIIFVEDLIGTGSQSTEYITQKLNLLLNPSYVTYLLTICATPEGISKVEEETNFSVINGILLEENIYQNYTENCNNFTHKEKEKLKFLNNRLKNNVGADYDRGLLVTFFYSPPNNSMPILWKDGYKYDNGKQWCALIPRQY
jgi:hypothetical protein